MLLQEYRLHHGIQDTVSLCEGGFELGAGRTATSRPDRRVIWPDPLRKVIFYT